MELWRRVSCTLKLMLYALLPGRSGASPVTVTGSVPSLEPRDLRRGMERYLDGNGELRVLFAHCLGIAAPFVLFRLKRQGFSRCSVRLAAGGLLVEARR